MELDDAASRRREQSRKSGAKRQVGGGHFAEAEAEEEEEKEKLQVIFVLNIDF